MESSMEGRAEASQDLIGPSEESSPAFLTPSEETAPTGDTNIIGPNIPVALHDERRQNGETAGDESHTVSASEEEKADHLQNGIVTGDKINTKKEQGNTNEKTAEERGNDAADDPVDEQNDESKYPGGAKLAVLAFGLCMAIFVVALDNTIIATAIPKITTVFNSLNDVGWYGSSYLLTTTSLQPSFGKVYAYFNVKWTYLSALLIFELGSVICAAAKNSVMLIVGRAVAGAGAAALFSGGMTIVAYSVPLRKRAIYIALLSSMFGIASVIGPLLGGVLTDRASWRWCFWINLPFGAVALITVFFFFKNPERKHDDMSFKQKLARIDLFGAFLLICAIVCLLLALQWGGSTYPWHNSKVWGCILGFGLLIICFVAWQFKLADRYLLPVVEAPFRITLTLYKGPPYHPASSPSVR